MDTMDEAQSGAATTSVPEYEWGVQYRSCWSGDVETLWGFSEDPQLSGIVDAEGDIEIRSYYHEVVAVGKRPKVTEIWTNVQEKQDRR